MSRDINPFGVRMPQELKDTISKAADKLGRSMNAEIVHRLEESFNNRNGVQEDDSYKIYLEAKFAGMEKASTELLEEIKKLKAKA